MQTKCKFQSSWGPWVWFWAEGKRWKVLFKCEGQQLRALSSRSSWSQPFPRFILCWDYHSYPWMAQWCCQGTVPGSSLGSTEVVPLEFLLAQLSPELVKSTVCITWNNPQPLLQNSPESVLPNSIFKWDCMALVPAGLQTHLRTLLPTVSCTVNVEPSCRIQHRYPNSEIWEES